MVSSVAPWAPPSVPPLGDYQQPGRFPLVWVAFWGGTEKEKRSRSVGNREARPGRAVVWVMVGQQLTMPGRGLGRPM